ncbi:MAG: type II toxin-antitoxin system VapC family toxin [Vicinamibacteria bacterium]
MRFAVDSSVLLAIFGKEPTAERWMEALIGSRRQGQLVICDVVYAEIAPAFKAKDKLDRVLEKLGVQFEPIATEAAWLAGRTFKSYRRAGGPREHLIPDFLIAAHAQTTADRLAADDRGYYRKYFPALSLLTI